MSFTMDHHHLYSPTSYRKARPASVSSSGFHSQRRRTTYNQLSSAVDSSMESYNGEVTRRSEKEILQALNDRFAGYIDKVRNLELHNRNLEAEAQALRQSQAGRASVGERYERELDDLRGLVQQLTGEKARVLLEHEHLEEDIQHVRARLEDEARNREEVEAAARAMNKYVDECGLTRSELDKKLHALEEETVFLKKNHEEEVAELLEQIQGAQVNFEVRDVKADVTSALREIRAQLDSHATKSATQAEQWFKVRVDHLSDAARSNQDAIRGSQEEIAEYRRQLQSRTIELETLRGTKESLERQCMESEDRHHGDLNSLQETIHQLDSELKSTKWEMASQLREYQELLNVKMALDIEIAAYRKLLEGEETRFVSGGGLYSYMDPRISAHLKLKGEDISDTVIVEEQTDETQVTEVTEEADDEEEEEAEEEEDGEKTKEDGEDEAGGDDEEEGKEEKGDEEEAGEEEEEKSKSPEKAASPPSKSPQSKSPPKTPTVISPESKSPQKSPESKSPPAKSPMPKSPAKSPAAKSPADDKSKSPASKSPESKSPAAKSPAPKSPVSKSPTSKSPESKSPPPKSPEPKSPVEEKAKPPATKEEKKEEKKEEQPQPATEEKKEQPAPVKEEEKKKQEPKEKEVESKTEKTDKPDAKKESKAEEAPKKDDTPKPAAPAAVASKPAEDKPAPKESPAPAKKEEKPAPKAAPEKTESKKEEKKPEEKKEKKDAADSKEVKEGGKTEKAEKPSSTDGKESKDEKAKK